MTLTLLRTDAVEALAGVHDDMLTVATMRAIRPWIAVGQVDSRNLNVVGCMGMAASIALGLAIARPEQRILVLDGDGSLLMQLGSLVSVSEHQPTNLYHVVFENGIYETSGGQDVPGRHTTDLCAIALASGYQHVRQFSSVDEMSEIASCLRLDGPVFISLRVTGPGEVAATDRTSPPPKFAMQIENLRSALAEGDA